MTIWLIGSSIIAPALFWIGYFFYKDRYQPEPLVNLGLSYLLGFIAAYFCFRTFGLLPLIGIPSDPSALMDHDHFLFLLYCLGPVGFLEELFKLLPFLMIITCFRKFDEEMDGIIYASIIALGFASYENLHYIPYLRGFQLMGRAIASPLTHTIFASVWGYLIGSARLKKKVMVGAVIIGLLLATVIHGLFDYLTWYSPLRIFSALLILLIWIWRIWKMEKLIPGKGLG